MGNGSGGGNYWSVGVSSGGCDWENYWGVGVVVEWVVVEWVVVVWVVVVVEGVGMAGNSYINLECRQNFNDRSVCP